MKMAIHTRARLPRRSCRRYFGGALVSSLVLTGAVGCSLQGFDYLTNGGASSTAPKGGGTSKGGSSATVTVTGGGSSMTQGGESAGGVNNGGTAPVSTASTQGGATQGGASSKGGSATTAAAGGSTGGAVPTGGTGPIVCPAYSSTGTLVTPPSNSFETSITGWTTTSEKTSPLSLVQGDGTACDGSAYLLCDGTGRGAGWDGPGIDLLPYLVTGHKYAVTLVGRYDPKNAPAAAANMSLTVALMCQDSSVSSGYTTIQQTTVWTSWTRFSGNLPSTTLAGCTTLLKIFVYLQSDSAQQSDSIDADDFRLLDLTSSTGSGGASSNGGGGSSTNAGGTSATSSATASGGASAAGGISGTLASGGAAAGGAASGTGSTGGATANGGATSAAAGTAGT